MKYMFNRYKCGLFFTKYKFLGQFLYLKNSKIIIFEKYEISSDDMKS